MEEKFLEYLTKLENALTQYGPQAAELTLEVARVGAIQTVVYGLVSFVLVYVGLRIGKNGIDKLYETDRAEYIFPSILGIVVGIFSVFPAFMYTTNLYAWIGMFRPEIYLISKAIQ